jgi:hypothetical protein
MSEMDNMPAPETPADQAPEPNPSPALESAENAPDTNDVAAIRRQAASYRRQLRGAETERDGLREQLDTRDRADVERLAGATMADGRDLWVAGVELAALRDDDGTLSVELVEQAVADVLEQRPHWRKARTPSFDGGARTPVPALGPSFGEALKRGGGT